MRISLQTKLRAPSAACYIAFMVPNNLWHDLKHFYDSRLDLSVTRSFNDLTLDLDPQ